MAVYVSCHWIRGINWIPVCLWWTAANLWRWILPILCGSNCWFIGDAALAFPHSILDPFALYSEFFLPFSPFAIRGRSNRGHCAWWKSHPKSVISRTGSHFVPPTLTSRKVTTHHERLVWPHRWDFVFDFRLSFHLTSGRTISTTTKFPVSTRYLLHSYTCFWRNHHLEFAEWLSTQSWQMWRVEQCSI